MLRKMPNTTATVLILDDDADIVCAAQMLLRRRFGAVHTLTNPTELPDFLSNARPDVVLLDLNFSPGSIDGSEGLALLEFIRNQANPPAVIVMTAYADVPVAVAALKLGATDFITKPWDNQHLVAALDTAINRRVVNRTVDRTECRTNDSADGVKNTNAALIGKSAPMLELQAMIASVAPTEANVMILGENGVGKELVARAIHEASSRTRNTFLSVDMGALPESTFESELFGHRKGSFTGAIGERAGRFQAAHGGTLFLDEIGNLPLAAQAKLLTVLERREVTPLGSDRAISIDIRIVCATNLDEVQLYQPSVFRSDLLFRLNTIVIRVPPLRERGDDVLMLLSHYLTYYERQYGRQPCQIDEHGLHRLLDYRWTGNVRELRQCCERAVILGNGPTYCVDDFGLSPISAPIAGDALVPLDTTITTNKIDGGRLDHLERDAVSTALQQAKGNISHAARALGISRAALYRKIEKHGI